MRNPDSGSSIVVLHLISSLGRGGRERQISVICRHEQTTRNTVLYYNHSNTDYIREYGLENRVIRLPQRSSIGRIRDIRQVINDKAAGVIVSWGIMESVLFLIAHILWRKPFINFSIQHGIRGKKISHYFRSFLCWISPQVVANSRAGLAANNIKPSPTRRVLYNGIENRFRQSLEGEELARQRMKLIKQYSGQEVIFVSVANLVPYKDYLTVLEAMNRLKNDFAFIYLIIGEGPMRPAIEQKILEHGLAGQVCLLGSIENVSDYLAISDYQIHSSKGEGVANAILEGMYAGLPVIASKVGGVPETVFPGSSSLFTYQDTTELYTLLKNVRERFSGFDPHAQDYQDHLNKFSSANMISCYESIIKDVVNGKK